MAGHASHVWRGGGLSTFLLPLFISCLLLESAQALSPGRFQFAQPAYSTTEDFGVAYITVQRSLGVDGRAAVYVSTLLGSTGGNAVAGRDFKALFNRSLVWQDGDDIEKELYVQVLNDGTPQESPKTFTLYLHDANGAQINAERSQTQVVLVPPANLLPGSFRFLNASLDASEILNPTASSAFVIPVLWENGTTSAAQVAFETICESACSGADGDFTVLSPANGLLKWTRGGPTIQNILIAIPDDNIYEQMESFRVRLQLVEPAIEGDVASVGVIGAIGEVEVHIAGPNDVHAGSVQFEAECFPDCASKKYSVSDGGFAQVVLQRRNGSDSAVSVTFSTVDDTAVAGVDYRPLSKMVTWAEGDADDKVVLVETIPGVSRRSSKRFSLTLTNNEGALLSGAQASTSYVDILVPSNIVIGDVNFASSEPLDSVLHYPDVSFISLVTRLNSGLDECPRVVVTQPGVVTLLLQRNFANVNGPASVTLRTVENTAIAGLDFEAFPAEDTPNPLTVAWTEGDASAKSVSLTILDPKTFFTDDRTLAVEIASVTNVNLGNCHHIDVILQSVAQSPHIVSFDLDVSARTLALTLSHSMLAATLDASKLLLQSEQIIRPGITSMLQLSSQTTTGSGDGTFIVLDINVAETNALKALPGIAISAKTLYLSVTGPGLFQYKLEDCTSPGSSACASRPLDAMPLALAVKAFVGDTVSPALLGFSLDLSMQMLKLRFSEPVNRSKMRIEALALADATNGVNFYRLSAATTQIFSPQPDPMSGALLSDGNKLPADGTYLALQLGGVDLDALKAVGNGQIGLQRASTFISISKDFIADFAVPANPVVAIEAPAVPLLQAAATDCTTPCPTGTFLSASCSDMKDRVCSACTVCPTNSFALGACTAMQDTVCYPCTECRGSQFAAVQCSPTTDRVCASCTKCTRDEYEVSPCQNGVDRVCHTCDSCALTKEQQKTCGVSFKWRKKVAKAPYACPLASQTYQTLEARLQRAKSNRCGAGRCSCSNSGVGNFNPNAESFPDDFRCTEPAVYNIFL